ncbi:MAG: SPOR domain-containing protein [Pseudoxanthomonas sp.]
MLIRALIVLLVVLNLGTAAWWLTRQPDPVPAPRTQPPGLPRLQLLSEVPKTVTVSAAPAAVIDNAVPVTQQAPTVPASCFSLGPFADRAAASTAGKRLAGQVTRAVPREVPGKAATGYNVSLPPAADRAAAQAIAQRIGAAGFEDYLVVSGGEQANGIALGRYGSKEGAERRLAALKAAGFDATVQAVGGDGAAQWWLDASAAADAAVAALRATAGAAQSRSLDCVMLR